MQIRSPVQEDSKPGSSNPFQYCCLGKIPWTEEPGGLQSMGLQNLRWLSNWIHRSRKLGYWESCLGKKIVLLKTYFWIILFTDFNLISTVQAWTNRYKKSTIHWLLVVKYFTNITYDPCLKVWKTASMPTYYRWRKMFWANLIWAMLNAVSGSVGVWILAWVSNPPSLQELLWQWVSC